MRKNLNLSPVKVISTATADKLRIQGGGITAVNCPYSNHGTRTAINSSAACV